MNKKISLSARPWIHLPVEIKVRELEARVLTACIAVQYGYGVLMGRNGFNTDGKYPKGIYFDKCISSYKVDNIKQQTEELGNKVVSLDIEGLVYQTRDRFLRIRTSQETVDMSSLIFTWGKEQYDMFNERYSVPDKLVVTGSPTADLWQEKMRFLYQDKADQIKEKYGDFILIPSNFSTVINANGDDFLLKHFKNNGLVTNREEEKELYDSIHFYKSIFTDFIKIIPIIANENKNINVIIRPHPGDDMSFWDKFAKTCPENVKVVYEGNVTPWILASKVLVHNNCSTGIEAFAMNKPVVAYVPHRDKRFEQNIPNTISQTAKTTEKLLELINLNISEPGLGREELKKEIFNRYIENNDVFSSERMIRALERLEVPSFDFSLPYYGVLKSTRIAARKAKRRAKDFFGLNNFSYSYRMQKNPGISEKEVFCLIKKYQSGLGCWGNVKVKKIEEDLFCFYS